MTSGPSLPTIKRLFAESRNACAMHLCPNPLVDVDGVVVGRICHIHSASDNGPRANAALSPEERHAYENLLLLCSPHHDVIDKDVQAWPAARLLAMKLSAHAAPGPVSTPVDDGQAERVARQLAHTYQTYVAGIMIGSIIAENVQIAHGNIINNAAPVTESERIVGWIREELDKHGPLPVRIFHSSQHPPYDQRIPDTEVIHVVSVTDRGAIELQRSTRAVPQRCKIPSSRVTTFESSGDRYVLHVDGYVQCGEGFDFIPLSTRR